VKRMANRGDRIVLVQPGPYSIQLGGAILHLPLALMSLAAWLRHGGIGGDNIRILDMHVRRLDERDFEDAAVVGVTAMTGRQIRYGLEAAELARRANPDVVLVWGGVHPTLLPEQTARHELVDVVVMGEGEETFREVVEAVLAGDAPAGIPGTCVAGGNGGIVKGPPRGFLDMDSLPLPAYDLVDVGDYHGIEHQFDYQSSRGCPFRCGFCYNTVFCGRKWRSKSAGKVVEELAFLSRTYRVRNFAMVDDEFFINVRRVEEICDGIIGRGLKFGIIASCRLDIARRFPPALLEKMKSAGIVQMFFGAESGSDETLEFIGKDITAGDITRGALVVARSGIRPILSFMGGFPGESFERFEETLDMVRKLWKLHPLITVNGIFPFNAYPGTALYDDALRRGLKTPETLEEWGGWTFQYEPDNPWLDDKMKTWMQISFYIVRFRYYLARFEDRHRNGFRVKAVKFLLAPLILSARVRLSRKWFRCAWEWKLFAFLARKTFGYL